MKILVTSLFALFALVVLFLNDLYADESDLSGTCLVIGNGPERYAIEALGKEFETLHPKTSIDFFWHENAKPVNEVKNGDADIAITGQIDEQLPSTVVAWDGIAVVTNFANPIEEITTEQLKNIFTGKFKFWSEVYEEGPEARITVINRSWNQNIRQAFEKLLGITNTNLPRTRIEETESQTFKAINGNIYAISYVSMGPALQARKDGYGVTLLFIDHIEPEYQTVLDGTYPLRRPVVFVTREKPSPISRAFLDYVLSPAGQRAVKIGASGLFQDKTSSVIKFYPLKGQ